jgi:hypothetical protein
MESRKTAHVERIIKYVKDYWQLSVNDEDCLTSVLDVFRAEENSTIDKINYLVNNNIQSLLGTLNDKEVEDYALDEFDLIPKDSEDDLIDALDDLNYNWIDQVDEDEMISALEDSGYTVDSNNYIAENIVEESQFEEWTQLFIKLSVQERENILKDRLC